MPLEWESIPSKFTINDIGAYLMANLAQGLYTGPEIIREYVQNAVDSYVEFTAQIPEEPSNEVRVDVRDRSIIIYDRGIGMGESVAVNSFLDTWITQIRPLVAPVQLVAPDGPAWVFWSAGDQSATLHCSAAETPGARPEALPWYQRW